MSVKGILERRSSIEAVIEMIIWKGKACERKMRLMFSECLQCSKNCNNWLHMSYHLIPPKLSSIVIPTIVKTLVHQSVT